MHFVPTIKEVYVIASYLYGFIYEVSYAKRGFMHFVPTKKEVYVICTQKLQKCTEKSWLFKNLNVYFVPNFKTLKHCLSLGTVSEQFDGNCSSNGSFLRSVVLVRIYLWDMSDHKGIFYILKVSYTIFGVGTESRSLPRASCSTDGLIPVFSYLFIPERGL